MSLCLIGSITYFYQNENSKVYKILKAFSIVENTRKLFHIGNSEEKQLRSLNGFRVLSMFMVMMGHSYSTSIAAPIQNMTTFTKILNAPLFSIIGTATFAVDTFFFLSGFLTFYLLTSKIYPLHGKINVLGLYLHWYLRLFPLLFFGVLFGSFIYPHIDNGTNFDWVKNIIVDNCSWYWWSNFLFINNIVPWSENDECMAWVWYLANDMQFFIISPFLISLYFKNWKAGYILICSLIVITCIIPFTLSMIYKIPAVI